MTALVLSSAGALGIFLLYSSMVMGERNLLAPTCSKPTSSWSPGSWLYQAGLKGVRWHEFTGACVALATATGLGTYAVFGGLGPAVAAAGAAGIYPVAAIRNRRRRHFAVAQDSWPRMIEEIRVLVTNTGMSIPQAVFTVGHRSPAELAQSFAQAQREWLLSTNFERALALLKEDLAHPTSDIVCETLLTAHQVGGVDLDQRLRDLAEDRRADVQARKDARAKQAGARFARGFVFLVPLGMALVGLNIGSGRDAYRTQSGQLLVAVGLSVMFSCFLWAGRIMTIPSDRRVFSK